MICCRGFVVGTLACLLLLASGCGPMRSAARELSLPPLEAQGEHTVHYTPPYVPVTFAYSLTTQRFGISSNVLYHTAVGTFGYSPGVSFAPAAERSLQELDAGANDLVLLFSDRKRDQTTVYHIKDGHDARVVMDGRVILNVHASRYGTVVSLDVTDATVVELYPQEGAIQQSGAVRAAGSTDRGPQLLNSPPEAPPAGDPTCILPNIAEFYVVPTGKHGEFTFHWRVEGADLIEMWGERYPAVHDKTVIIKEPSPWNLWAKVAGTADDCYVEQSIFVEP